MAGGAFTVADIAAETGVWLGIDIGGTNTKIALIDRGATRIVQRGSVETDRKNAAAAVARAASIAAEWVQRYPEVERVGITLPGHFDAQTGCATVVPNIPGPWLGQPVRTVIEAACDRPVTLINDARAFGLAESRLGAARGGDNVVALVLGTGVGGALIFGGQLYHGQAGLAGEIGHLVLQADGPQCGCGNRGCLEALTRADVLATAAGADTVAEVVARAEVGDELALSVITDAGRWMGLALANLVTLLTPSVIVLGGGVAQAGEVLFAPLRKELEARSPLVDAASYRLVVAELGTIAGAVGAAVAAADSATNGVPNGAAGNTVA